MLKAIWARAQSGYRTIPFPNGTPNLPARFRGLPQVDQARCVERCTSCADVCPTNAIMMRPGPVIDLGRCLFCTDCMEVCPVGAITFTNDFRLATRERDDLVMQAKTLKLAQRLDEQMLRLFGRALKLRQVSAGGCNGCEVDVNVLGTIVYDIGRFGIQFVASPRHADGVLVTGPVTQNMRLALEKTLAAVPDPKLVIAVGACAISGGPFHDHEEVHRGADSIAKVDLFIPGCPPHPLTVLHGLLSLLNRL